MCGGLAGSTRNKTEQRDMSTTTDTRVIQPYLFFNGRCEEALEFYRKALGGETGMVMRYKDSPEAPPPGAVPPGFETKIMHASFRIGQTMVMASDGCSGEQAKYEGFSLSLSVSSDKEAEKCFKELAKGGRVETPLTKTFFASSFGMVVDRFGICWMVLRMAPEHRA